MAMVSPTPALPVGAGGIIVTGVGMVARVLVLAGVSLLVPHVCGYINGTRGFVVAELYAVITRSVNVITSMNYGLAVLS